MIEKIPESDLVLLNRNLRTYYGNTDDRAHFRLSWSDDQYEKVLTQFTKEGIQLLQPQLVERKKYPLIKERYILEKLTVVPTIHRNEIIEQLSYEPIWTFEIFDEKKNKIYVRPIFGACKYVVERILEQMRCADYYTKYGDSTERATEESEAELKMISEQLFGNESAITDALSVGQGVAYGQSSNPNSSTPMHSNPLGES